MPDLRTDHVRLDTDEHVATITLDRPEKHNALTVPMRADVVDTIREYDDDPDVRAIVVTGAGDEAFCAGADLDSMIGEATGESPKVEPGPHDLAFRHEHVGTPLLAAVNGACVGGGMEFVEATDIRVAAESASFGLPEPRQGLAPIGGSTVRLPRQIPHCEAMRFLLTGERFPAEHADEVGLINEVVPDGESLARATEIAGAFAETSPHSVAKIKESVARTAGRPLGDAFRLESAIGREVFAHPDAEEGPAAFLEKRRPDYRY
jgi:enoyl-CoA hydratase